MGKAATGMQCRGQDVALAGQSPQALLESPRAASNTKTLLDGIDSVEVPDALLFERSILNRHILERGRRSEDTCVLVMLEAKMTFAWPVKPHFGTVARPRGGAAVVAVGDKDQARGVRPCNATTWSSGEVEDADTKRVTCRICLS
jgi:hypothetical protein